MKRTIEQTWRQVSPYLDEMLDLEPEARHAWVEALAARAPDIAAEVGAYLAELEELEKKEFLGVTVVSILAPPSLVGQHGARGSPALGRGTKVLLARAAECLTQRD